MLLCIPSETEHLNSHQGLSRSGKRLSRLRSQSLQRENILKGSLNDNARIGREFAAAMLARSVTGMAAGLFAAQL